MAVQEELRTPEEREKHWLEHIYQADAPQLTARAVLTGALLGGIMSLSNLYVGLKSGWGLGVDIAAIILAFAIWKAFAGILPMMVKREFNIQENTIMMTTAVAASWISSAGLVSAVPALTMVSGRTFIWWQLVIWIGSILILGLFMAIPLKRQMITVEKLRFPYNISVVETLKAMHSKGGEAMRKAKALGMAGGVGVIIASVRDGFGFIPGLMNAPLSIGRISLSNLTLSFEPGFIMMGIGALFGIKVGISMLVGALLNYGILAPYFINQDVIKHPAPTIRGVEAPAFPLTIEAGHSLTAVLERASTTHEYSGGTATETLTYTWSQPVTYAGFPALLADLNAPAQADGSVNPFHGHVAFRDTARAEVGQVLLARAFSDTLREASLTLPEEANPALAALGFSPGATRHEGIGGFRNVANWSMWPGAGILVSAGLMALFLQWKTLARTFGSFGASFRRKKPGTANLLDSIEIPGTWFLLGFLGAGLICVIIQIWLFSIHWWMGILAVLLTFFLAAVAARAGAEVGINPIGAMGKVTQLLYGVISPGNMATNLMTANVTAGAASSCSDTVGNLYVGHQVGANPRKQFIAQMFGVVAGAFFAVPAYFILVPDASTLGGAKFPAPAAIIWAGVARILSQGLQTLPPSAIAALVIAVVAGIATVILERLFPKIRPYTLSPTALGIAMTIPAYNSISMFMGSLIVWVLEKRAPATNEMYTIPVASGLIAGESLTGVAIAALMAFGFLS
ncbi:MAG: OPT family oligopeptide transporter [Candidatus Zixiibacteriota bacterium]|nr:MAG: OPT family oligopeptide transporter [candidate division Zixibacteria bacterium]